MNSPKNSTNATEDDTYRKLRRWTFEQVRDWCVSKPVDTQFVGLEETTGWVENEIYEEYSRRINERG